MIRLLMRVREAPAEREIGVRARAATEALMALPLEAVQGRSGTSSSSRLLQQSG
jgi:hypothetical protein